MPRENSHVVQIDVLRGVAIASVLLFHLLGASYGIDHPGFIGDFVNIRISSHSWWLFLPLSFGWVGVPLFFVISGYVIHRSHLKRLDAWIQFASRRFWRLYPAYIVILLAFAVWQRVPVTSFEFLTHLTLVHDFWDQTFFGKIDGSFWSLAVEVQLYALYPLLFIARSRWGWPGMMALSGLSAGVALAFAYLTAAQPPASFVIWNSPITLWPSWAVGAVIAEKHLSGQRFFSRPRLWLGLSILLSIVAFCVRPLHANAFLFAALGAAVLVDQLANVTKPLGMISRLLALLGTCSYSVYLIHQPLLDHIEDLIGPSTRPVTKLVLGALCLPAIAGLGYLSYRLIELPGTSLGAKLSKALSANSRIGGPGSSTGRKIDARPAPELGADRIAPSDAVPIGGGSHAEASAKVE